MKLCQPLCAVYKNHGTCIRKNKELVQKQLMFTKFNLFSLNLEQQYIPGNLVDQVTVILACLHVNFSTEQTWKLSLFRTLKLIHSFPLYFVVQPQITQEVKNLTVAEEHVVSFVCKASGNPQPTFYWEKGGKKLNTRRNRFKVFDMPFGSVLRIESVKPNDNDFFTCVAENGVGDPVRSTGHLKVYRIDREGNGKALWVS